MIQHASATCSVSIVIPNFNGEAYLAACLESVTRDRGRNTQIIVADGASTDGSLRICRDYLNETDILLSEKDNGQSHAINKGLRLATGDIVAYLNSDDVLEPGALPAVTAFFIEHPDAEWLAGGCRVFGEGIDTWYLHPAGWTTLADTVLPWERSQQYVFPQSGACFMRRSLIERLGPFDETLHYSMDMEYYARAAFAGIRMHIIPDVLAAWRLHRAAKTWTRGCTFAFRLDEIRILQRYLNRFDDPRSRNRAEASLCIQQKQVIIREANYWRGEGQRLRCAKLLAGAVGKFPSVLFSREWLGAVRRVLTVAESAS